LIIDYLPFVLLNFISLVTFFMPFITQIILIILIILTLLMLLLIKVTSINNSYNNNYQELPLILLNYLLVIFYTLTSTGVAVIMTVLI
jgi:hypothetical protein